MGERDQGLGVGDWQTGSTSVGHKNGERSQSQFRSPDPQPLIPNPYAVKLLPHPHPPVAFGLLNVKPEPCIELT